MQLSCFYLSKSLAIYPLRDFKNMCFFFDNKQFKVHTYKVFLGICSSFVINIDKFSVTGSIWFECLDRVSGSVLIPAKSLIICLSLCILIG